MQYKTLVKIYKKRNPLCKGKLGKVYVSGSGLFDIPCQKWFCMDCRPHKKFEIYLDILRYVYIYDLQKHFIITFEGKKARDICKWDESYYFMAKQWDKFRKVLEYKFGKIKYILLPRAQNDGFCHYHIITNKYMEWKFLNEKRKKYGLGYVSIQRNKDVAEYLNKDYFNDQEFYIPLNVKHFRSSIDIKLNYNAKSNSKIIFNNNVTDPEIKKRIFYSFQEIFDLNDYYEDKLINKSLAYIKLKDINKQEVVYEQFCKL